jgi:competence protein ComEC
VPDRWLGCSPFTWAAIAAWSGALVPLPVPLAAGPLVVLAGWRTRQVPVLCVGLLLLTSALAARTDTAQVPLDHGRYHGEATIMSDPRFFGPSLRVDLQIGGHRVEAWARGPDAARLAGRLTGERIDVGGRVSPPPPDAPWLAHRQVVGRMSIDHVGEWRHGHPVTRAANGFRRTVESGTTTMDRNTRSLYVGLLFGDTRQQAAVVADSFRGAGLTHLLAVSGMNVAFVLTLVGPLLRRMPLGRRLVATLAVLLFFALITRFTPSVMRAATMAGFAAMAVTFGRESDSRRTLAAAVVALLVIDPMIAHQLAFQLSVLATTGILLWSGRIARAVPLPEPLANALGLTVAAQIAVAPLLIPTFGGMPVASLLANLLAAPVAGLVVVWGFPAGIVGGVFGGRVAELVHIPTALVVGWIGGVAGWCATLPLGEVRTPHVLVALAGVGAVWLGGRSSRRWCAWLGVVVILAALAQPGLALRGLDPLLVELDDGTRIHVAGGATVIELDVGARPDLVLEALRRNGIRRLDVVVARHGGRDVAEAVAALGGRFEPRLVLAPDGHRVPGGSVARPGSVITAGGLEIHIGAVDSRVEVEVRSQVGAPPPPV